MILTAKILKIFIYARIISKNIFSKYLCMNAYRIYKIAPICIIVLNFIFLQNATKPLRNKQQLAVFAPHRHNFGILNFH